MGLICYAVNILVVFIILTVCVLSSEHVTKREGETVVLHVNKPYTLETFIWSYGQREPTKVIVLVTDNVQKVVNGTRFGTRLHIDISTGKLTVQNLTIEDSGVFLIQILTQNEPLEMQFNLMVIGNNVLIQALEGTNVTLQITMVHLDPEYKIIWTENDFCGKQLVTWENNITIYYQELQDHLLLDNQTGTLTIINILKHQSGFYCVCVTYNKDLHSWMKYEVQVFSRVSAPHLSFEQKSLESKKPWSCRVNCSVQNSEKVVLKWFIGDKVLNQTNASDLSSRLVLPLNVPQTQEEVIYTCQAENPVSSQAVIFNTTYSYPQKKNKDLSGDNGVRVRVGVGVLLILGVCVFCVVYYRRRFLCHTPSPKRDYINLDTLPQTAQDHNAPPNAANSEGK